LPFEPLEKYETFKDIFQDFLGPGIFKKIPGLSRRLGNPEQYYYHMTDVDAIYDTLNRTESSL